MNNICRPLLRPRWGVVAGIVLLVIAPAFAQERPGYEIRHYDLRVEPDFVQKTVQVRARIEIDNPALAKEFSFRLNNDYEIRSLRAAGSAATAERGSSGDLSVSVPRAHKKVVLTFDLQGAPTKSRDEDRPVIDDQSLFLLWSDAWYPADFDRWATVTTTVVLPQNFQAIAPGKLVARRRAGGRIEYVFDSSQPTVSFSVFSDARWVRAERSVGGFRITTLLHPESQKHAEQIFATSADVLQFFSELHGGYPFDQFAFVTLRGIYARRAFPGWVGYSPEYLDKEMARTGYDAHEASLLWWGLTTHGRGPGSWQWTEGLGDYVEVMYAEARHKPLAGIFGYFRSEYLKMPAEKDVPYTELRGNTPQAVVHGKYPWLMQVMRDRLGDAAFRRGIRLLFERYRYRAFSMDEFIAVFEQASGQSLRWWREQWLERKGVPVVGIQAATAPVGGRYRVTCRLEQSGQVYELPLQIGLKTESGMQIETVLLREPKAEYVFDSAVSVNEVVLDPNERILMKKIIIRD